MNLKWFTPNWNPENHLNLKHPPIWGLQNVKFCLGCFLFKVRNIIHPRFFFKFFQGIQRCSFFFQMGMGPTSGPIPKLRISTKGSTCLKLRSSVFSESTKSQTSIPRVFVFWDWKGFFSRYLTMFFSMGSFRTSPEIWYKWTFFMQFLQSSSFSQDFGTHQQGCGVEVEVN